MTRSDPFGQALAAIERRLDGPLSLADVAAASGLSPFHFSRLFTAACGESVMAYVRRRRLARAARRLAEDPRTSLVELAFDSGFESQQAFTRAFTRQFGVSPGRFRRPGLYPLGPKGEPSMTDVQSASPALERLEGLQRRDGFVAAGFMARFDADSRHAIPALWRKFLGTWPVAGRQGGESYGLCLPDPAEQGGFRYMAAVRIAPEAPAPEGLERLEVPAQTYVVHRLTVDGGPLHPQIAAAMNQIWGRLISAEDLKPSGGPDFEFYPDGFDERRAGAQVEFWAPVAA